MDINRRDFLKFSGGAVAAGAVSSGLISPEEAEARRLQIMGAKETTTICPYCAVGCGIVVHTKDGKVINTEGDPNRPHFLD